jgi:predicted Rossmann fold nucleotide-binding protein DprA/Smf involved in DNA uptake
VRLRHELGIDTALITPENADLIRAILAGTLDSKMLQSADRCRELLIHLGNGAVDPTELAHSVSHLVSGNQETTHAPAEAQKKLIEALEAGAASFSTLVEKTGLLRKDIQEGLDRLEQIGVSDPPCRQRGDVSPVQPGKWGKCR